MPVLMTFFILFVYIATSFFTVLTDIKFCYILQTLELFTPLLS